MKGRPRIFVSSDPNPGKMQSLSSPRLPPPSPPQAFALPEDSKENPGTKGVTLRQALPRLSHFITAFTKVVEDQHTARTENSASALTGDI